MQRKLAGLDPERVWYYFEDLCQIPRGSGNTAGVSAYCADFAREHGLRCISEECGNVIIFRQATEGFADAGAVILQGHLDMVAAKDKDSDHDFLNDPLDIFVEDGWVGARGTTLGGDDGIAVAYMLALLDSEDIPHPALECVFTVEEETGMDGARALDASVLTGRSLINLDSEEEGILWSSCAGGMGRECVLPVDRVMTDGVKYHLEITGLLGGHSGTEINKERGNAVILMGRLLYEINAGVNFTISEMRGGEKDNAIPALCTADIIAESGSEEELETIVYRVEEDLKNEYQVQDPGVTIVCRNEGISCEPCVRAADMTRILFLLNLCPYGVQNMSCFIDGLVETSLNLGIMELGQDEFRAEFSIRSSVRSRCIQVSHKLDFLCELLGGRAVTLGEYPGWKYRPDSRLRNVVCEVYTEETGSEMKVDAVHAGLECGVFDEKIPDLDIVSIGPDMRGIHTPSERLSVESVKRTWELLCEVLGRLG